MELSRGVAQYYGKRDYAGISKVCSLVLWVSCITAVIFMAAAMIFPEDIMRFFTNEPELVLLGSGYLRMVGVSWILSAVSQVYINL